MQNLSKFKELKDLQNICEKHDRIWLKLNWNMLKFRGFDSEFNLYHYENDRLVGFLGMYPFENTVELCGMVHPNVRRKGIFTQLLNKAIKKCNDYGIDTILLNIPANSQSGLEFAKKYNFEFEKTEYQMKWTKQTFSFNEEITIRPATAEDLPLAIHIDVQCFQMNPKEAEESLSFLKQHEIQSFYMVDYLGTTVGKIQVVHLEEEAWIYGFAILPEWQGKGIGREAIKQITMMKANEGYNIFLEVEANNHRALKLYKACGYHIFQGQHYYIIKNDKTNNFY